MNTKKIRPILIPIKSEWTLKSIRKHLSFIDNDIRNPFTNQYYNLILISLAPDEKIENGDRVACFEEKELTKFVGLSKVEEYYGENQAWCYDEDDKTEVHPLNYQFFIRKVIAIQDKLSSELINKLIEEYNNGGMRDFEIEMEEYGTVMKDFKDINYRPKLTNGFITPVENKHKKHKMYKIHESGSPTENIEIKLVCCGCGDKNPLYIANNKPYCLSCKPF